MTKGRSKGASVVLGFQDIEGLRDVYGTHRANVMMGMCSSKAILRLLSPETAAWASKLMGDFEKIELRESTSSAGLLRGRSRTQSEQRVKSEAVLPSEFLTIPPTDIETGLSGYFVSPWQGAYQHCASLGEFPQ